MIYVLGSLNVDEVARLRVFPKKGETVLSDGFVTYAGGKGGNQASAVAKIGGKVAMIGCVGSDDGGRMLMDSLQSYGVDTQYVVQKDGASGKAMIWLSGGDNRIAVSGGANLLVGEDEVDVALAEAKSGDILMTQLEIPLRTVAYAFKKAKEIGMTTILNPAPASNLPQDLLIATDILIPNEHEMATLTGIVPKDIVHTTLAVKALYQCGAHDIVVTMGGRGSVVAQGQTLTKIPARKVAVVDTTAAGDTYCGAVAVGLQQGMGLVDACTLGSRASSITVSRAGAIDSIPSLRELEELI